MNTGRNSRVIAEAGARSFEQCDNSTAADDYARISYLMQLISGQLIGRLISPPS